MCIDSEPTAAFLKAIEAINLKSSTFDASTEYNTRNSYEHQGSKLSRYSTNSSLSTPTPYIASPSSVSIIKGLRNEGFYCYLNSSIQLLLAVSEFTNYLKNGYYKHSLRVSDSRYWKVMAETVALMESDTSSSSIVPQSLRKLAVTRFRPSEQQDVHELLCFLLSGMQDEINPPRPKGTVNFNDPDTAWADYKSYSISVIDQLFAGQLMSIVTCGRCGNISKTYEAFVVLTLPMVTKRSRSVDECLEMFTAREEIKAGYQCERCRSKGGAYKQFALSKLPRVLIVHLNRIQMRPRKSKIQGYVEFPIRTWRIRM